MAERVRVGIVGCGAISTAYLRMASSFPILEVAACGDLDRSKAEGRAAEFGVPRVLEVDELLADPSIEIVLNLTVPKAHAPIALAALAHGKHTLCEKPLAVDRASGAQVLETAERLGRRVACAPDTFLGAGLQTARAVIDRGDIGRPVSFTGWMLSRGHESWHPSPEFYYQVGGGPMFDMGPYYVTALLNLLGPAREVTGVASIAIPDRVITSKPLFGKKIDVETPDHVCGSILFENGALGTLMTSFATAHGVGDRTFPITVYGTEGALRVPDPNGFDGPVQVRRAGDEEWQEVPHLFLKGYGRAVGLADLAHAVRGKRPHRCSAAQAFAVLDVMQGFLDSSQTGKPHRVRPGYVRPAPMPALPFGILDD